MKVILPPKMGLIKDGSPDKTLRFSVEFDSSETAELKSKIERLANEIETQLLSHYHGKVKIERIDVDFEE